MEHSLVYAIAKDIEIMHYEDEILENYTGRLVYSAMVQWLKVITQDSGNMDEIVRTKSKSYVFTRGTEILNQIILAIPQCENWFWNSYNTSKKNEDHPIRVLRERMLYSGELIETDLKTNIGVPNNREEDLIEGYKRIYGVTDPNTNGILNVGIAQIQETEFSNIKKNILINPVDFVKWLIKAAEWEKVMALVDLEFFQPLSKEAPYKSWNNIFSVTGFEEICLGRIKLYNDYYEYYLLKIEDNEIVSYKLSSVLYEFKEERRIILALRTMSGNSIKAISENKKDVVLLKLFCRLPIMEERIIETYCWPQSSVTDKLKYVVPIKMWGYVKQILNTLQIEVKE